MVDTKDIDKLNEVVQRLKRIMESIDAYDIPRTNFSAILEDENLLAVYYKEWSSAATLIKLEIEELNKCEEDVNRWPNYRLANNIDFFIERVMLYLKGGVSKYDGAKFSGLYTYFNDINLKNEILDNDSTKKLLFYKKEMEFFSRARYSILRSIREGGWEEFYDFYNNLKKGRKYIRMVRETFGNHEFADFLENLPKEVHENPTVWEEDLKELSERLNNFTYQNRSVIHPSAQALLILFHKTKEKLFEYKGTGKRNEKLMKGIGRLRKDFDKIDAQVIEEISSIMPVLIDLMVKLGIMPETRLSNLGKTLDRYGSWLKRFKAFNQIPLGDAFFSAIQSDKLAATRSQLVNMPLVSNNFESYINQLEGKVNTRLIPRLRRVINFIRNHDNQFTIPVSSTKELLPEIREFISGAQNQLIDELKRKGINLTNRFYG